MWMKTCAKGASWALTLFVLASCASENDSADASPDPSACDDPDPMDSEMWTDTATLAVGDPPDDTVLLLFGRPQTGEDALRCIVETHREDIRLLESDSATRSKYANPDSVAASLRAQVVALEAELEAPPWTIARADSMLALVQSRITQIRESGQALADFDGEPVALEELLKADAGLREVIAEMRMYPEPPSDPDLPPGR